MQKLKITLAATLCVGISGLVQASPQIELVEVAGINGGGTQVTVWGSDFGERFTKVGADNPHAPLIYSTFEKDMSGSQTIIGDAAADIYPYWTDRGDEVRPAGFERRALINGLARSSELSNSRSVKMTHIKTASGDRADPLLVSQDIDFVANRKIFFSYWVRFQWPATKPDVSYQYKLSTVVTDVESGGHVPGGASMQLTNWMYPSGSGSYTKTYYRNSTGLSEESNSFYFPSNTLEPETSNWRNIVLFWDPGTPGELDGHYWSWSLNNTSTPLSQHGSLDSPYYNGVADETSAVPMIGEYDTTSVSDFPNSIKLAWYLSKLSTWNVEVYFDDVVADNTWAQIFVGNKPNFDDCTILEYQEIVDWQVASDGSMDSATFNLRYGSLKKDDPMYVYILNEEGQFDENGVDIKIYLNQLALKEPGPSTYSK